MALLVWRLLKERFWKILKNETILTRVQLRHEGDEDGVVGEEVGDDELPLPVNLSVEQETSGEPKNMAVEALPKFVGKR